MKEEEIIRQHDTGRRPFTVPEGYFEQFTDRLMERLPEKEVAPKVVRLPLAKRLVHYAAAAVLAGCILGVGTYFYRQSAPDAQALLSQTDATDFYGDEDIDDVIDYEMLNNQQIAYYLTEAY